MGTIPVSCYRYEEANQEQDNYQCNESHSILHSAPEARTKRLGTLFCCDFIILFIPKVGEGDDKEAEDGIEGVESIIDDLEGVDDIVNPGIGRPILPSAQL